MYDCASEKMLLSSNPLRWRGKLCLAVAHNLDTICRGVEVMKNLRNCAWSLAVLILLGGVADRAEAQVPYGPPAAPMMAPGQGMPAPGYMPSPYQPQRLVQYAPGGPTQATYTVAAMAEPSGVTFSLSSDVNQAAGAGTPGAQVSQILGGGGSLLQRVQAAMPRVVPQGMEDCCRPRWFDIHFQGMYLKRDEVGGNTDFTSDGILGPIVLGVDDLDFDNELGLKLTVARQLFGSNALEMSYFGLFNYGTTKTVNSSTDNLYSVFSDFGTNPFGGFGETDQASQHGLEYSSSIDSVELHIRRRWQEPDCRWQGSVHAGVRFVYLLEDFRHTTRSDLNNSELDYLVKTRNSMVGFQLGGDLWSCLAPGIRAGVEVKAGIYGVRAQQDTTIEATSITTPIQEHLESKQVSFILEGGAMGTWRINQNWNFRGGYQIILLDGVALAAENFNSVPPFVGSGRPAVLVDNGEALYHGFTAGAEWSW